MAARVAELERAVRALAAGPDLPAPGLGVEPRGDRARLHGGDDQALVAVGDAGDMRGRGEGGVRFGLQVGDGAGDGGGHLDGDGGVDDQAVGGAMGVQEVVLVVFVIIVTATGWPQFNGIDKAPGIEQDIGTYAEFRVLLIA